ncbi:MAG: FtsX-like permease family protein [bacterium]|nr:FtsX-like permease family protein [bacterium]
MKKINLKIFRNLWQMKLHAVSIALTIACGIGIYSGVDMALNSLYYTRDKIFSDLNFADLEIQFIPEDIHNLPDLSDIQGIDKVEKRLIFPGIMSLPGDKKIVARMVFLDTHDPAIDKIHLLEGRGINGKDLNEVVAEKTLRDFYGFKPGDTVKVKVGEKEYENKIVGFGVGPEYVTITANPEYFLPEKGSVGVLFTSLSRVSESLGFTMVNDLIIKFKPGINHKKMEKNILARLSGINIEKVIPFKDHFAYKYLELDLLAFKVYVPAIVIVLGSLSFIIALINFSRLIIHERKEIGAVLAIGYHPKKIIFSYFLGGIILGCFGIILGIPFAIIMRNTFTSIYGSAHGLIFVFNRIFISSIIKGILFGFSTSIIASLIPVWGLLKLNPHDIMHPVIKNSSSLNRSFFKFIFIATSKLSIGLRLGIRNILRKKYLSTASVFSIGLSIGVAVSYMISMSSLETTIKKRFDRQKWTMVVDFLYPVYFEDYEEIKKIEGIKEIEPYFRYYAELGKGGNFEGTGLFAIVFPSKVQVFPIVEGRNVEKKDEIIINNDLARKLKLKVGDAVELKVHKKIYPFTVCGIKSDVSQRESVIDFYRAREILEFPDEASGIMIDSIQPVPDALMKKIHEFGFIGKITKRETLVTDFIKFIREITGIVNVAIAVSVFVAILFIFTSSNMGIMEREGEYATLKSIGYDNRHISVSVFTEALILTVLGGIVSIPLAISVSVYLNHVMSNAWFDIENFFYVSDFMKAVIPLMILGPLSIIPGLKYLFNLDIQKALKIRMIE